MQRPTPVRIMLLLTYFKMIMTVMIFPALFRAKVPEDVTAEQLQNAIFKLSLELLVTVGIFILIRRRKHMLAITCAVASVLLITSVPQLLASVLIVLLFFLRNTRVYFQSKPEPAAKADNAVPEVIDVEGERVDEVTGAEVEAPSRPVAQPKARAKTDLEVAIRQARPEDADTIHSLMLMSFEEYRSSIPPSSALEETSEGILEGLQGGSESAAILYEDDVAVATVRYRFEGETITFFRLSVIPSKRRRGYAKQLVKWVEHQGTSKSMNASRCKVRQTVQNNVRMYQDMGYEIIDTELVVRPTGSVKALTLEKDLRPQ